MYTNIDAGRVYVSNEPASNIKIKTTKITVDVSGSKICVFNNGDGILTTFLEEHGVYAPELVFGHINSSSKFDDNLQRLKVGRNGLGAKVSNIFSRKMIVETVESGKKYRQVFSKNMSNIDPPTISDFSGDPITKATLEVDTERFGMDGTIPNDVVSILRRRAHEVSTCSLDPVKVCFNGGKLKTDTIDKYMKLVVGDQFEVEGGGCVYS